MTAEISQLVLVNASFFCLIIAPFLPAAILLFRQGGLPQNSTRSYWPRFLLMAMVLGIASQSVSGMLWSHFIGKNPSLQVWGFVAICAVLTGVLLFLNRRTKLIKTESENTYQKEEPVDPIFRWAPLVICFCAFTVRAIHPLQESYLGQSDAYTHLNYLHNILEQAELVNPAYPPGYHWILALPSLAFSLDPYFVTRFGGAFFGVGLVLAIYVFLEILFNKKAAIYGSFCAACFPLMILLQKTGVGAFANQCGLLLLPALFLGYCFGINRNKNVNQRGILLLAASLGIAATVPMMLIHVFVIVLLERLICLLRHPRGWCVTTVKIFLYFLPAIVLLAVHTSQMSGTQRTRTAGQLVVNDQKIISSSHQLSKALVKKAEASGNNTVDRVVRYIAKGPYFKLILDFVRVKRSNGFGNLYINIVAVLLGGIFALFVITGLYRGSPKLVVLGLWGGVTLTQAATGALQFSAYQREGWSLLISVCCVAGIMTALISRKLDQYRIWYYVVVCAMLAIFAWSLTKPPSHLQMRSSAEGDVIDFVRFLGQEPWKIEAQCIEQPENSFCQVVSHLDLNNQIIVINRKFSGWRNQGEIVNNVSLRTKRIKHKSIDGRGKNIALKMKKGRQYVTLIDSKNHITAAQRHSAFAMVTPKLVNHTMRHHGKLYGANRLILDYIDKLDKERWKIDKFILSEKLKSYVVTSKNHSGYSN